MRSNGLDLGYNRRKRAPAPSEEPSHALNEGVVLDILDRVQRQGETYLNAGKAHGLSRSSVAGLVKRMIDACEAEDARPLLPGEWPVAEPENRDGGMDARWWQAGLDAQLRRRGVRG